MELGYKLDRLIQDMLEHNVTRYMQQFVNFYFCWYCCCWCAVTIVVVVWDFVVVQVQLRPKCYTHTEFDPTGFQIRHLQIMDITFHVPDTPVLTTEPSGTFQTEAPVQIDQYTLYMYLPILTLKVLNF